jgi:uncharacterized protein (TIGR00255 family)
MSMNSMTGFGRSEMATRFGALTVEVSSVNNRFLEVSMRLPRYLASLEPRVREQVGSVLDRGQISVFAALDDTAGLPTNSVIDLKLAAAYARQLRALQKSLKLSGDISISDLTALPDVARVDRETIDLEAVWKVLKQAIDKALVQLLEHRQKEGRSMAADMKKRLSKLSKVIVDIEKQSQAAVVAYRKRLSERVNELLGESDRENLRLEEEIVLMAERTDITEECTRFKSHIDLYQSTMNQKEPAGKRLNFILQEMNREANTIGSKCSEFAISSLAITLKEEVEKLRELVQNVE